jgi:hypothetical protein
MDCLTSWNLCVSHSPFAEGQGWLSKQVCQIEGHVISRDCHLTDRGAHLGVGLRCEV